MKVFEGKVPIFSWCNEPEEGAIEQARNLSELPFVYKRVCLMPDTHQGYGMPIGGVIGTVGVVIPNAVGVDIGCGMASVKTSIKVDELDIDTLKKILSEIRKVVPVGFNKHKEPQSILKMPELSMRCTEELPVVTREYDNARKSLGTLGGGNHFIEIQKGDDGFVYVMVHSGSRNLGKQVCDHYNKLAMDLNKLYFNYTKDLAFLPLTTKEGQDYIREMKFALDFAQANRDLMIEKIKESFNKHVDNVTYEETINIHHNYAALEHHFGMNVMIHRKGATRAYEGEIGLIPGSQGTSSYIVRGLGNSESFKSCSHGAGRKMSRKKAQKNLDIEKECAILDEKGVIHSIRNKDDLDEAPSAYKDIDVVMEEQKDLVEIVTKLEPLAVIKG